MSIAEKYYTDKALVQKYKGLNDRGDTAYEDEVLLPCRFDYSQKETIDAKGNKILSSASVICDMFIPSLSIVKNDLNERFTVKSCEPVKRISGEIDHYEVIL